VKYLVLVWAGLWRKPARTILTSLSIIMAFLLYGALNGTMYGFEKWIDEITGDAGVLYTGSRVSMSAGLPIGILPTIERIDGVASVDIQQEFNSYFQDAKNGVGVVAIDVARRIRHPSPWSTVSEGSLESMQRLRTGAIAGRALMEKYDWKMGDRIPLTATVTRKDGSNLWVFEIVGVSDATRKGSTSDQIWINYDYFDEARAFGNGTIRGVWTTVGDPSRVTPVATAIDRLFANSPNETVTRSIADMIRAELDQITNIQLIIDIVLSAVLFTLLFVTGNTMMQSVAERIPELAVLKTYGFSDGIIASLILIEATLLCLVSALIGIAVAALVLFPIIGAAFQTGTLPMAPGVIAIGIAISLTLACVIALPPVWRASRLNVVDALAGR
jgi:putative ABC transport system permease protein